MGKVVDVGDVCVDWGWVFGLKVYVLDVGKIGFFV